MEKVEKDNGVETGEPRVTCRDDARCVAGAECIADTSVAGRPARQVAQDRDPVCEAAQRHLRHSVLPVKVRPRYRHPRHVWTTRLRPNCRQGDSVVFYKVCKWPAFDGDIDT